MKTLDVGGCRCDSLRSAKGLICAAADSKTEHYREIVQGLRLYCIAHVWSERCITVACGREGRSKLGFLLEENLRAARGLPNAVKWRDPMLLTRRSNRSSAQCGSGELEARVTPRKRRFVKECGSFKFKKRNVGEFSRYSC